MFNPFFQHSFVANYYLPAWVFNDYAQAFLHSDFAVVVALYRPHLQSLSASDLDSVSDLDFVSACCLDLNSQLIHPKI